jgi:hypothetical protein
MTHIVNEVRRFSVHARHLDAHHAQVLEEASFEAAAVAYVEELHVLGDDREISVIVRELGTGQEHCFRIDVDSARTTSCG